MMAKIKDQHYDEVVRLYFEEGYSEDRIAQKVHLGHTTVNRWLSAYAEEHGKTKADLREEMGGNMKRNGSPVESDVSVIQSRELRILRRKLNKARLQVMTLETMIQTLENA